MVNITAQTIKMEKDGGVYKVPCKVNGLALKFIFDTGASGVSISATEAFFMIKNGYLNEDDLGGSEYYRIANGDIAEGTKVTLRKIEIGDKVLFNVKASIVHSIDAPLLLGQSVMERLGQFTIDYATNSLIIGKQDVLKSAEYNLAKEKAAKEASERKAKEDAEKARLKMEAKAYADSLNMLKEKAAKEASERKAKEDAEKARLERLTKTRKDSLRSIEEFKVKNYQKQSKIYESVSIGNQVWMSENLNEGFFRNGDTIQNAKAAIEWEKAYINKQPAWCYYENDSENELKYGKLYNWYAVTDPRGLCPVGWHIPSYEDWNILKDSLGGADVAGGKMKSISGWNSHNIFSNNESGFSGLPGGYRTNYGTFLVFGDYGLWWSTSEADGTNAWYRSLKYSNNSVSRTNYSKGNGLSVRCLRD
ncbi:MAG: FISUMP domain-containing protein [Bacteroidia bacterium]